MDFLKNAAKTFAEDSKNDKEKKNDSKDNNDSPIDFLKSAAKTFTEDSNKSSDEKDGKDSKDNKESGVADQLLGKLNSALGGGEKGEQKEDMLDKAIDLVQEKVFKVGAQDNESAAEQAKDKMIADAIRSGYKTVTGNEFPISDKK